MVYSKNEEDHAKYLKIVMETIRREILYRKLSNYMFWSKIISFLGHICLKV